MDLPLPAEAVVLEKDAPLVDGAAHDFHREVELAADAFASALADFVAGRLHADILHAAAQATAPTGVER